MQKWSSKSESTRKTKQNRSYWKILIMVKVNGQRSKSSVNDLVKVNSQKMTCADVAVWHHLRAYVAVCEAEQARGVRGVHGARGVRENWHMRRVEACEGYWRRVVTREACAREAENSAGVWRRVWCSFWPFLVRFYSGLAILSLYAFSLAIEWAEH